MPECVVDAATAAKLLSARATLVVKDATGRVLGRFTPDDLAAMYAATQDHGLTPEELERRLAPDAKTYTTAEVLAHLRSLK